MIWTVPYYPGQGQPSETNVHPIEPDVLNEAAVLKAALVARPSTTFDFVFVSQKGGRLHRSQIFRDIPVGSQVSEASGNEATLPLR